MDPQILSLIDSLQNPYIMAGYLALVAWATLWKGIALWKAATHNQRNWFIAILLINTFGILEIIYIFYFTKPKTIEKSN